MNKLTQLKCVECEVGGISLTDAESQDEIKNVPGWKLIDKTIQKRYKFKDFIESMKFVNAVAQIAENNGHHPDIIISYNKVTLNLTTHAIQGLSLNDFIVEAKIDEIK